jgi:hypothetical protein
MGQTVTTDQSPYAPPRAVVADIELDRLEAAALERPRQVRYAITCYGAAWCWR